MDILIQSTTLLYLLIAEPIRFYLLFWIHLLDLDRSPFASWSRRADMFGKLYMYSISFSSVLSGFNLSIFVSRMVPVSWGSKCWELGRDRLAYIILVSQVEIVSILSFIYCILSFLPVQQEYWDIIVTVL